jgi:hypothetical protein
MTKYLITTSLIPNKIVEFTVIEYNNSINDGTAIKKYYYKY